MNQIKSKINRKPTFTKPIIPIVVSNNQANTGALKHRKRGLHRYHHYWASRLGFYVEMGAGQKRENEISEKRRKKGTG